jgi:hypothetical protein
MKRLSCRLWQLCIAGFACGPVTSPQSPDIRSFERDIALRFQFVDSEQPYLGAFVRSDDPKDAFRAASSYCKSAFDKTYQSSPESATEETLLRFVTSREAATEFGVAYQKIGGLIRFEEKYKYSVIVKVISRRTLQLISVDAPNYFELAARWMQPTAHLRST